MAPTQNPAFIGAVAVLAVGVMAWQIWSFFRVEDGLSVEKDYFVDEETMAFERHTSGEIPPLRGRSGKPTVVIARCFQGDEGRVIGWLERYPEEVKVQLEYERRKPEPDPDVIVRATFRKEVRSPVEGAPWVAAVSAEGREICQPPRLADGSIAMPLMPDGGR